MLERQQKPLQASETRPEELKISREDTLSALNEMLQDPSLNDEERLKVDNEIIRLNKEKKDEESTDAEQAA